MLAIRLKRTGRSGHAQFRLIVQDGRFHPTRGKVVAYLGSYDPHQKSATIDKELAAKYLASGAQPSDTAARLLKKEGVKLPEWVSLAPEKKSKIKHPEKLRRNRPADALPTETPTEPAAEAEAPAEPESSKEPKPADEAAQEPEVSSEVPKAEPETPAEEESAKPAGDGEQPA